MKRIAIAWALLFVLALGVIPAAASGPVRDIEDYGPGVVEPEQTGDEGEEDNSEAAGLAGGAYAPTQSVVSVSGGLYAAGGDTSSGAAAPGTGNTNTAPVAENQQIQTYRGVSVGGQLTARDAEGDALTFEIATAPMKGSVQLSPEGYFVYTPKQGKRGKDYFGFRATDSAGNVSQEGTVIIKLVKQKSKVTYSDLTGSGTEYAAVVLTENGVFTGENVGSDYVLNPEAQVTRGEFLSMCMTAAEHDVLQGVSTTGFQDDASIGPWLKPYVATALMHGYIQGEATATGAAYNPGEPITLREACVTLNSVLGVTDVVSAAAYVGQENSGESWAQAVANLTACGVMPRSWEDVEAVLTRAGAAELLANAIGLLTGK